MLRFTVRNSSGVTVGDAILAGDRITIGPDPGCSLRIPLPPPAKAPLRIEHRGGEIYWIDGEHTRPLALPGSVRLGDVELFIERAASQVAATPQRTASLARELVRGMVAAAGAAPRLHVRRGPWRGQSHPLVLGPTPLVVGRGDEAHWILPDPDLSGAHFAVAWDWEGIRVRDLSSKNGVWAGRKRLTQETWLGHGKGFVAGQSEFVVVDPAEAELQRLSQEATASGSSTARRALSFRFIGSCFAFLAAVLALIWVSWWS